MGEGIFRRCAIISIFTLRRVVLSIFTQQKYFCPRIEAPRGAVVSACSLSTKSRTSTRDVIYTSATQASVVNDVTDFVKMVLLMAVFLTLSNGDF